MRKDRKSSTRLSLSRETIADLAPSVEQTLDVKGGNSTLCSILGAVGLNNSTFSDGGGCATVYSILTTASQPADQVNGFVVSLLPAGLAGPEQTIYDKTISIPFRIFSPGGGTTPIDQ